VVGFTTFDRTNITLLQLLKALSAPKDPRNKTQNTIGIILYCLGI